MEASHTLRPAINPFNGKLYLRKLTTLKLRTSWENSIAWTSEMLIWN